MTQVILIGNGFVREHGGYNDHTGHSDWGDRLDRIARYFGGNFWLVGL
jgi:hypothetical protein